MIKLTLTVAAALAVLLPSAHAQSQTDVLRRILQERMPAFIGKDNTELAKKLVSIKPEGAISRSFDPNVVAKQMFGRARASSAPDCTVLQTTQKEPEEGACVMESGRRDDPIGAYLMLAYSKNTGIGDVKFVRRAAFKPEGGTLPAATKLTDVQAYEGALKFLELVGVPKSEIPQPPAGIKNPYPVRSLAIGGGEGERSDPTLQKVIRKVVSIPRAFTVPGGIYKDPASGNTLNHVLAPGGALVVLDDAGVQFAHVDKWSDAQIDAKLDPRRAKSADQLLDEISEDLYNEGVREVGSLSILIGLRRAYPNPDDPNPPLCPVCGVLRPALLVTVAQAGGGPVTSTADNFVAAGLVREYDLIDATEEERPAR